MADLPELLISAEKVCAIISMARQFDAKVDAADSDEDSDEADEDAGAILEDRPDNDAVRGEIVTFIHDLNIDEQVDLVALMWLGRGDGDLDGWGDLRTQAADAHNNRTASYLLGAPLLADYLEDALSQFGRSCEEFEADRL
jgi:hypothetical protein